MQQVKPNLTNNKDALEVAFTEIVTGRAPEERGNGLKFVKKYVTQNPVSLVFQSGDAELEIPKENSYLHIRTINTTFHGCIAIIKF